jgi:hypothetical protein
MSDKFKLIFETENEKITKYVLVMPQLKETLNEIVS